MALDWGPRPQSRRDFRSRARRHQVDEPGRLADIIHSLASLASRSNQGLRKSMREQTTYNAAPSSIMHAVVERY